MPDVLIHDAFETIKRRGDEKCENRKHGTVKNAGVENASLENAAPVCRGWKMRDRMERQKCNNEQNCEMNNEHTLA